MICGPWIYCDGCMRKVVEGGRKKRFAAIRCLVRPFDFCPECLDALCQDLSAETEIFIPTGKDIADVLRG